MLNKLELEIIINCTYNKNLINDADIDSDITFTSNEVIKIINLHESNFKKITLNFDDFDVLEPIIDMLRKKDYDINVVMGCYHHPYYKMIIYGPGESDNSKRYRCYIYLKESISVRYLITTQERR